MRAHRCLLVALAGALASMAGAAGCRRSVKPPPGPVEEIAVGEASTCARFSGGSAMCWGASNLGSIVSKVAPDKRRYIPLTGPETAYYALPVSAEIPRAARKVVLGETHGCALLGDGGVQCWGGNYRCQLGTGKDDADRHLATPVPGVAGATAIAGGNHQTCVVVGGAARCWGMADQDRNVLAACSVREMAPAVAGAPVIAVAAGVAHACALRADGSVWCWGKDDRGQLGRGALTNEVFPAGPVPGLGDVREIAASASTTCARRGDGTVWCWGAGGNGQLGSGDTLDRGTAARVLGGLAGATQIAVGASHACALDSSGSVRCWGSKQAVGGGGERHLIPVGVSTPGVVRQLVLGGGPTMSHSCALTADGQVHCWGSNFFGQLGDGSTNASHAPVRVAW